MYMKHNSILMAIALSATTFLSTQALSAEPSLSEGGYAAQLQKLDMMKMLDGDGNHMVTKTEADTYFGKIFSTLDRNNDGLVSEQEWGGPNPKPDTSLTTGGYDRELRSMQMMGAMDANADHKVTKEEFLAYHQTFFVNIDKSGDGEIDSQEWVAKHVGGT